MKQHPPIVLLAAPQPDGQVVQERLDGVQETGRVAVLVVGADRAGAAAFAWALASVVFDGGVPAPRPEGKGRVDRGRC